MKHRRIFSLVCAALIVAGMTSGTMCTRVSALSSDEIQSQIDELEEQNQEIQAQLAQLEQQTLDNHSRSPPIRS